MNKLMYVAIAGTALLCGCACQNCCDLEGRVAALEQAGAARAEARAKMMAARKDRPAVKAARPLAAPKAGIASYPALRTAAQVRFAAPKIVDQWLNPDGQTISRVVLQNGVYTTNSVPKIVITGTTGPTKYSKKSIGDALAHLGYWPQVKQMLQATETEGGRTFWDVWVDSAWFLEDDPIFTSALEAAKRELGITQEQLDAVLANCIY